MDPKQPCFAHFQCCLTVTLADTRRRTQADASLGKPYGHSIHTVRAGSAPITEQKSDDDIGIDQSERGTGVFRRDALGTYHWEISWGWAIEPPR